MPLSVKQSDNCYHLASLYQHVIITNSGQSVCKSSLLFFHFIASILGTIQPVAHSLSIQSVSKPHHHSLTSPVRHKQYSFIFFITHMSHIMRKPAFCQCKNKAADQLRSICTANQHLCFCYIDTIPLLANSEISSF